jgi:uncharacterized protein (DUF58 family)
LKTADDCVRAAGSLMFAALDEGHHVEWLELGAAAARLVPPFDDGHELLDALARLRFEPDRLTGANLRDALTRLSPKSGIALVLTTASEEAKAWVQELVRRGRPVSVYLPAGLAGKNEFPGASVFGYGDRHIEARQ